MDGTKKGLAAAVGFCLFLALILFITAATVYNIAGDASLMGVEMRRNSSPKVSGLPDEKYPEMGQMIAEYLTDRRDTFQFYFTDKEGSGLSTDFDKNTYRIRNLWTKKDEGKTSKKSKLWRKVTIPAHDVVAYRLYKE